MAQININSNGITQYTDDSGIQFNNIDLTGGYKTADGSKWTAKNSMFLPDNAEDGVIKGRDTRKFINAVDIDWNGAQVEENVTLNSTGDLLSWIKTKGGGGTIPTPDPQNPDEPTDSSPSVVTLTEDEFNQKLQNGELEEKILYIVVDANGRILFMYQIIDGVGHRTYMPEPSQQKETGTITLDDFNNLNDSEKASKNWIITDENGNKIGIALEGVLLLDATIEEAEVDGVGYKVIIVDSYPPEEVLPDILYLVKDNNGKITTSYLNGNEIELEKVNGLQKSDVTEMFKKDFVKDNEGNIIGLKHTGISIDRNGDGEIIESTEFNSYLYDYTNKSGFISNADGGKAFAELFATSSTNGKLKSSEIIAAINKDPQGGETSSVTINADKINVDGIFDVKVVENTGGKTVSQLLVDANGLSSRVSNVEDNRIYLSNINQDAKTIDLNIKYTDGSQAKNASLTLGVDANNSSKIIITADQIKLKGDTFTDTIFSKFVTADYVDSKIITTDQILSEVNGTEYLYVTDDLGGTTGKRSTAITPTSITFWDNTFTSRIGEYIAQANSRQNLINNRIAGLNEYSLSLPYKYPGVTGNTVGVNMFSGNSQIGGYLKICENSAGAVYSTDYMLMAKARGSVGDQAFDIDDNFGDTSTGSKVKKLFTLSADGLQWSNHSLSDGLQGFISIALFDPGAESSSNIQLYDSAAKKKTIIYPNKIDVDGPISATSFVTTSLSSAHARIISQDDEEEGGNEETNEETSKLFIVADESKETAFYCSGDVIGFVNKSDLSPSNSGKIISSSADISNLDIATDHHITTDTTDQNTLVIEGKDAIQLGTNGKKDWIDIIENDNIARIYSTLDVSDDINLTHNIGEDSKHVTKINASAILDIISDYSNKSTRIRIDGGNKNVKLITNDLYIGSDHNHATHIISDDGGTEFYSADHDRGFSFDSDLNVVGSVYDSSDSTLKDIVSDTTLTVEQIANAPAVNFTWKKDADKENKKELVGTLAQYWQVVLPQVVGEGKDGKLNMQYGNAAMVSSIVTAKEVVELKSKVQDLEAENARLKLRLAKIEEKLGL